jgi:hypothetical protein
MKKISTEFVMHMFFAVLGALLFFAGLTCIGITIALPTLALKFEGIVILSLGAILLTVTKIYFSFLKVMELAATAIEKMNEIRPPAPQEETTEENIEDILTGIFNGKDLDMKDIKVHKIVIDENTSREDIEKIRQSFFGNLEDIEEINSIIPSDLSLASLPALEKYLESAVESNEYETAALIRDEINKRKENL